LPFLAGINSTQRQATTTNLPSSRSLAAFLLGDKMNLIPANDNHKPVKLLRFDELNSVKGIRYTRRHIAGLEDNGDFPVRVKIGQHCVGWVESEIDAHVAGKIAARPARKAA